MEMKKRRKKSVKINFVGNSHTNFSSRKGHVPLIIVNHISEGSASSCINWFTTPNNKVSSTHFLVGKDGSIYQFVPIEEMAWGNGLKSEGIKSSKLKIIKEKEVNPNLFSVSIEHEGIYHETKGALTKEQLDATIWLHGYIIQYVKDRYQTEIPINRDHILGHSDIDPTRKPHCPGEGFPYDAIINKLNGFIDIHGHWAYEAINMLKSKGIMKGYVDNTFRPNNYVTRAELAVIIERILNK